MKFQPHDNFLPGSGLHLVSLFRIISRLTGWGNFSNTPHIFMVSNFTPLSEKFQPTTHVWLLLISMAQSP
jgi:hypothetical protein